MIAWYSLFVHVLDNKVATTITYCWGEPEQAPLRWVERWQSIDVCMICTSPKRRSMQVRDICRKSAWTSLAINEWCMREVQTNFVLYIPTYIVRSYIHKANFFCCSLSMSSKIDQDSSSLRIRQKSEQTLDLVMLPLCHGENLWHDSPCMGYWLWL